MCGSSAFQVQKGSDPLSRGHLRGLTPSLTVLCVERWTWGSVS